MTTEERVQDFIERYGKLVEECKVDWANYPVYVPDGQGAFKVVIQSTAVDMTNVPVKSNLMNNV